MTGDTPLRLFLVAAEPSGDVLGAGLIGAVRERLGDKLVVGGVGGPRMGAQGVESPFDIRELSVLGFFEGLRAYPRVVRRAEETAQLAQVFQPDAAVLIDSWGFTLRVAQRLRRNQPDLKIIKYVGPQVWASRPGRAATLAAVVDHVMTLQPFEPPYFEAAGLPATFVGHPALDTAERGDGAALKARYGLAQRRVAAILFGSRGAEVRRLGDAFFDAARRIKARYGDDVALIAPLSAAVATQVRALASSRGDADLMMFLDEPEKADAFDAADVALACSGTVVTELAVAGVPSVAAYRVGDLTWMIARRIMTAPHVSLVNMAAGERLIPELLQGDATGEAMARAVFGLLDDPDALVKLRTRIAEAVKKMRGGRGAGGAFARAADTVLSVAGRDGGK